MKNADVVCTVTPSKEAYLQAEWIKPGCHVNAVGTFTPPTREVTSALVARSRLYADQVEAMKKEAGEYLIPLSEGLITEKHIVGSIGDVIKVSIKEAAPRGRVKKGDVHKAVIVRTAKDIHRADGSTIRFDSNAAVLVNNNQEPIGTRIFGPVVR